MAKPRISLRLILTLLFLTVVLTSPISLGRADTSLPPGEVPVTSLASYSPGVTSGQWAEYRLSFHCAPDPSICNSFNSLPLALDYVLAQITSVRGSQVTLSLATVYQNGTGSHMGVLLDVSTGYSNITTTLGPTPTPGNFFLVAANLQAHDHLFNSGDPRVFNETQTELVAGQPRAVNVLNNTNTITTNSNYGSSSSTISIQFHYDQQTGILASLVFAFSITASFGSSESGFSLAMTDNNIWRTSAYPDFGLSISPTSVSASAGSRANSTITVSRINDFSATVKLAVTSYSSSLKCTLSQSKLINGGFDRSTLSCAGPPGSYTVTITGDSGYTTHTQKVAINIASPALLDYVQNPMVDIGVAAAGIIIAASAFLLTRRKPAPTPSSQPIPPTTDSPMVPPTSDPSTPPPQA
jgi:hypothetical protein